MKISKLGKIYSDDHPVATRLTYGLLSEVEAWKNKWENELNLQTQALERTRQAMAEKERLLQVYRRIGKITLSSLDLNQVLDNLTEQLIVSGVFPSVMVGLVEAESGALEIVRSFARGGERIGQKAPDGYRPEDREMAEEVVRSGEVQVWQTKGRGVDEGVDKFFYYIPIADEQKVLAVLATQSDEAGKEVMLERIAAMEPMLDQFAVALQHATRTRQLRQAEVVMTQNEKMASLGQLAAGVGHEINNPLGFIGSNISTLKDYMGSIKAVLAEYEALAEKVAADGNEAYRPHLERLADVRQREDLDYIVSDVENLVAESEGGMERVNEIVASLKNFGRTDGPQMEEADINEGLRETLKIVWNKMKYKCEVKQELGALPVLRCHRGQLNQVFLNLMANAAQAITERGEVRIKTEAAQDHIAITIADTGAGIPAEVQQRIFEPFFTTKPVGEGTGLGLAISYNIIKNHGGTIEVKSQEGVGTEFTIRLPLKHAVERAA